MVHNYVISKMLSILKKKVIATVSTCPPPPPGFAPVSNSPTLPSLLFFIKPRKSTRFHLMSQSIPTGYIPPGNPRGLAQKDCPGGRDLTFESCPGSGNSTRAGILWKLKVKRFVRLLVLLVINRGCPKNC